MTSSQPRLKRSLQGKEQERTEKEEEGERRVCDLALVADHTFFRVKLKLVTSISNTSCRRSGERICPTRS